MKKIRLAFLAIRGPIIKTMGIYLKLCWHRDFGKNVILNIDSGEKKYYQANEYDLRAHGIHPWGGGCREVRRFP